MKTILGPRFRLFLLFFAIGGGLTFAVGWQTQFHALSNDYWNILYYGRRMTLSQPESLYNGFYPFGYAFLIGQMPFTYVLPLSYLLNALLTGLFTASVSTLIAHADSVPATLLALYASIAAPFIFQNANTLSPDIGAAAFTAFALFLLCRTWFDKTLQPPSSDKTLHPPYSDKTLQPPYSDKTLQPPYSDKTLHLPYSDKMLQPPYSDKTLQPPYSDKTLHLPYSDKMLQPPSPAAGDLNDLQAILAGVSLGLSFLWRTHAAVSILAILIGYFLLIGIRPLRPRWLLIGSLTVTAGLQVLVNLLSGHGALETAQAFNLYKFFNGVDWTYPPTAEEIENFSVIRTILANPQDAFNLYKPFFLYFISHAWAAALAFILSPKGRFARFSLFSVIFIVLYAIPISLSDSARSPVILMSVYVPSLVVLLAVLIDLVKTRLPSIRWVEWAVSLLFIALGFQEFYGWAVYDVGLVRAAVAERKTLSVIEQTLLDNGMTSPTQVFADRYDFYTPNTMPYRSRQIGNWSAGWVWGFAEEFPAIPNDSWEAFSQACKEQGVRFLVLSQNSHYRGDIFPPIYNDEVDVEAMGLRFIGQRGKMRIYEFDQP